MPRPPSSHRSKRFRLDAGSLVPIFTVLAAVVFYKLDPLPLEPRRSAAFDRYQRWDHRTCRDSPVRVIDNGRELRGITCRK